MCNNSGGKVDTALTDVRQRAEAAFDSGFFCAESVLLAITEAEGIASELLPGAATAFCSGQARTCGACGALNGALLAIGLVLGRRTSDASAEPAYAAAAAVVADFEKEFGSRDCRTLLDGCDLGSPGGKAEFAERGLRLRCRSISGTAAAMAMEAISRNRPAREGS